MNIIKYNDLNKHVLNFKYSNINNNKSNINCYLSNKNEEYSILIKTPKSELQSTLQSGFLVISFINTEKNLIFTNFIKKIEKEANFYIKNKLKKKTIKLYSSFIYETKVNNKEQENITKYIFNISKCSNSFKIFDYENNIIDKKQLDIYSNIVLLIKLQNIWIDLENKLFGLNWNIYQIKNYSEINLNNCLIFDSDDDNDIDVIRKEVIVQKCVFCSSSCIFTNNTNNINIAKGGKGIIKGGKGKGKSISIVNNNNNNNNNNNIINTSGRGDKKIEPKKKEVARVCLPSVNELLDIKSKLKKMVKINSDDD